MCVLFYYVFLLLYLFVYIYSLGFRGSYILFITLQSLVDVSVNIIGENPLEP